jgi:hypothetical protein
VINNPDDMTMTEMPMTEQARSVTGVVTDARQVYSQRLGLNQEADQLLERRSVWLSAMRLLAFVSTGVVAWLSTVTMILNPFWIMAPLLFFIALVVIHRRTATAQVRARRCIELYRTGLARLDDLWVGEGIGGDDYGDPAHPYAKDLDIFGRGSLFELLCITRSRCGERTMAQWLLEPAPSPEITERQQAVDELRYRVDLRERLTLLGEETAGAIDPDHLEAWGAAPPRRTATVAVVIATALPGLELLAAFAWLGMGWSVSPLLMLVLAHAAFTLRMRQWVQSVITFLDRPARELDLLAGLLAVIESEPVTSPLLRQLQEALQSDGARPADHITRLRVIVELLDSRRNMIFAPVAGFLLWTFHLACAAERWRARHGHVLATWFSVLGRFEALASISAYAYEHPDDPFPEIEPAGPATIEAVGLAHPLLPAAQAVRNDLKLNHRHRVLIVSGSNMSGKTTLLRSLGVNQVLAQAGAPVRAQRLRLSRFAIGASITTLDSLLEGRSRFFTEIRRCKQIVDLCEQPTPVLFLLDEILHGTNSHERRIGAELLVKGLLERGALGLVTTHDLALAELCETLAPLVANVHFEDRMVDGKLHFDYQLRPGTVTRSNALELMRMIGLPVKAVNH